MTTLPGIPAAAEGAVTCWGGVGGGRGRRRARARALPAARGNGAARYGRDPTTFPSGPRGAARDGRPFSRAAAGSGEGRVSGAAGAGAVPRA